MVLHIDLILPGTKVTGEESGEAKGDGPGRAGGADILLLCFRKAEGRLLWQRRLDGGNTLHRSDFPPRRC